VTSLVVAELLHLESQDAEKDISLAGGAPGKRMALPNSRMLIHQPSAGFEGQATDIELHANEVLKTRQRDRRALGQARRPERATRTRRHGTRPLR
jgi:ATP-dependent protease ClpP protease subunit